jgi:phosphoserine aminotransferase
MMPHVLTDRFNFSGGPGALPLPVTEAVSAAILEIPQVGLSLLGISHRSTWFRDVCDEAQALLVELLKITRHRVLFLQGGSTLQFSMIPMTFLRPNGPPADYIVGGYWSAKSVPEAIRHGPVRILWDGRPECRCLPWPRDLDPTPGAAYLHYVSSETVEGMQFAGIPGLPGVPLVCDMASDFLAGPLDVDRFRLIYAHAQKNLGPAGVTVVLLCEDWLAEAEAAAPLNLPAMLDYRQHLAARSIYNTPPVFAIYVVLLVLRWVRDIVGGLERMAALNRRKADIVYGAIDRSGGFYLGHALSHRSVMNVTYRLVDAGLEPLFLELAEARGLYGLGGHRSIGGLRASLYNAVSAEAASALASFMADFVRLHG